MRARNKRDPLQLLQRHRNGERNQRAVHHALHLPLLSGKTSPTYHTVETCKRSLQGSRMYIKHKCTECAGKGQTVQRKKISVPVPAGIEDGQTVRMSVGNKELFVTFRVDKSDYFKRDGADVHTEADISVSQALLGGTIRIQGLYEDHTLQVTFSHLQFVVMQRYTFTDYARNFISHKDKIKWQGHEESKWSRARGPLRYV